MITQTASERFLDKLVVDVTLEISGLRALMVVEEKERPRALLSKLGNSPLLDYIQETLERKLASARIPDGDVYVVTPEHYYRYKKNGPHFPTSLTDPHDIDVEGSLAELYPKLERATKLGGETGKLNFMNVLFFDNESKMRFHASVIPAIFKSTREKPLQIPDYDGLKMYTF